MSLQAKLNDTLNLRRAFVAAAPEYATDSLPVLYGDLTGGSGGVSYCPCIDTANFVHLISDSQIVSAANGNAPTFYIDGVATAPASWDDNATLAGRTVATVTWAASQAGKRVGYRGQGTCDGTGALISNPISVAEKFLTDIAGLVAGDFQTTALATAKAIATAQSYACAGVLDLDRSAAVTLAEILACFAGMSYVNGDGLLVIRLDDGATPGLAGLAAHLPARDLLDATAEMTRDEILNQCAVNYCRNAYDLGLLQAYQAHEDGAGTKNALSQSLHGARGPGITAAPLDWPWVRASATVTAVQTIIVGRLAWPRQRLSVSVPHYRYAHLEPGDYVGYSWDRMYDEQLRQLVNQIALVEACGVGSDGTASLTLRDTGSYLLAAGVRDLADYAG